MLLKTKTMSERHDELENEPNREDAVSDLEDSPLLRNELLLAFGIGALLGVGLAAIWIPEQPRRRPGLALARRYHSARRAGTSALAETTKRGAELAAEFREDLAAHLEAAREELVDIARKQIKTTRRALQRDYTKRQR